MIRQIIIRNLLKAFVLMNLVSGGTTSYVERARELEPPSPQSMEGGETEGHEFWERHASLLREAWREWESFHDLPRLDCSDLVDAHLHASVEAARIDPIQNETSVWRMLTMVAPHTYAFQLLDPSKIALLRQHIDLAGNSKIPTRRPNGMNRHGMIVNPTDTVDGSVAIQEFQRFYHELVDDYIRPIGRMVFSEYVGRGDDEESYAFTIRYKSGEDLALGEHSDASIVTLNVNLNADLDGSYSGSQVYFLDDEDGITAGRRHNLTFEPGVALLHLGQTRHAALPIEEGERTNLVIWLHGKHHYVRIDPYDDESERLTPQHRWSQATRSSLVTSNDELRLVEL
jgi:hypothetical protein